MKKVKKNSREELKKLQSMLASVESELNTLTIKEKQIKTEISTKKQSVNMIKQKIQALSKNSDEITVSEHAIVRYLERVMEIDMEDFVDKILPEEDKKVIKKLGNGQYSVNQGSHIVVVRNGVVMTIKKDK
ncbi:MAG: hypothetical protein Q3988_00440 [Gemella sp.]|nr:hypothetical protein [Gemella sp.]